MFVFFICLNVNFLYVRVWNYSLALLLFYSLLTTKLKQQNKSPALEQSLYLVRPHLRPNRKRSNLSVMTMKTARAAWMTRKSKTNSSSWIWIAMPARLVMTVMNELTKKEGQDLLYIKITTHSSIATFLNTLQWNEKAFFKETYLFCTWIWTKFFCFSIVISLYLYSLCKCCNLESMWFLVKAKTCDLVV